jgi:hypothetical protein
MGLTKTVQDRGSAPWPVTDIYPHETRWKVQLLQRCKTNIRNEVTLPAFSDAVDHRSRCQPQAQERAGLPKKVRRFTGSEIPTEWGKVESKTFQDKGPYSEGETSQGTGAWPEAGKREGM